MAKRTTHAVGWPFSQAASDKLMACLNHGTNARNDGYLKRPGYFDACRRWWSDLTQAEKDLVIVVIDACDHGRREAAANIAGSLPPAPKCPT